MKKSFKKSIAILLAVLMIVCAFPMSAFAEEEKVPNINIQIGALYNTKTTTNGHRQYTGSRLEKADFSASGLNTPLDYKDGVITDGGYTYKTGDYITVSVVLENISQLAASEVAVKYSDNLIPAGCYAGGCLTAASGRVFYAIGEPMADQSGDALYNKTQPSLLGELSYLDSTNKVMYAAFAAQDGGDYATSADGKFVLATYMFQIASDGPVTFSLVDDATADDAYYLGTVANGGKAEEYVTFVETENAGSKGLAFMNKDADGNAVNAPTVVEYTITFVDKNGTATSTKYAEGATVTVPELPATVKTTTNHTTYAWDITPATTASADATYTVVGTTADHAWNAGVVTKEATETATGIKTYTCTVCGQTKTETIPKKEPAHTHSYTWVYNEDATYTSSKVYTDGTATGTCSCGDKQTKTIAGTGLLRATTATVNLGAAVKLIVAFTTARASSFVESYPVITFDGKDYPIKDFTYNSSQSRNEFSFDKIAPEYFGEQVVITMYGVTADGIVCKGHPVNYSIKQYATSQLKGTNTKLNTLLVEMLYYGEADRVYRGHTNKLASPIADLTDAQKALHTDYIPTYNTITDAKYVENESSELTWVSVTMGLEGKVIPKFKFRFDKTKNTLNDFVFHATIAGKETTITYAEHPELFEASTTTVANNVAYYVCVDTLDADQFREAIYINATHDGKVTSNTLRYSIESYTSASALKSNALLKALVDQLLRYGRADAVYTGKAANYQ